MMTLVNMRTPLKGILPRKSQELVFLSYIQSIRDYGAPQMGAFVDATKMKQIERVKYQTGLIVSGLPRTTSYTCVLPRRTWLAQS